MKITISKNISAAYRHSHLAYTTTRQTATCSFLLHNSISNYEECPIRHLCEEACDTKFDRAFGTDLIISTLCEPTNCPVVRSEVAFHESPENRLTIRKHLYEIEDELPHIHSISQSDIDVGLRFLRKKISSLGEQLTPRFTAALAGLIGEFKSSRSVIEKIGQIAKALSRLELKHLNYFVAWFFSPMKCSDFSNRKITLGEYIGFVDLRLGALSPIALAVLSPPSRMRRDPDVRLISGDFGPYFGGPSFQGTVFTSHDKETSGAQCAQACVWMCQAMLMDRLSEQRSPLDITVKSKLSDRASAMGCQNSGSIKSRSCVPDGLKIGQLASALSVDSSEPYAPWERPNDEKNRQILNAIIVGQIDARLPVVMYLDGASFWRIRSPKRAREQHAVVIVGYRRNHFNGDVSAFVCHDPGKAPYLEEQIEHFYESASNFNQKNSNVKCGFTQHSGMTDSPEFCIESLKPRANRPAHHDSLWQCFLDAQVDESQIKFQLIHRNDLDYFLKRNGGNYVTKELDGIAKNAFKSNCTFFWVLQTSTNMHSTIWVFQTQRLAGRKIANPILGRSSNPKQ